MSGILLRFGMVLDLEKATGGGGGVQWIQGCSRREEVADLPLD